MKNVFIIIPTYNERTNVTMIIEKLQSVFAVIPNYKMHIVFYDSNSPDGTADLIKSYQEKFANIYLLTEEKKSGLGNAYIQAMTYAIDQLHADIIFEFDADGSHNPTYLPDMMTEFTKGADVVLGSRYIKGGSIPKDWAFHRKLLSIGGNLISRCVLTPQIKDFTSGFRGTRSHYLKAINLNSLKSRSYAYKIHLMWKLYLAKAKIVEFPIHFIDRQEGYSKLPKNNMIESLKLVFYLRLQQIKKWFLK